MDFQSFIIQTALTGGIVGGILLYLIPKYVGKVVDKSIELHFEEKLEASKAKIGIKKRYEEEFNIKHLEYATEVPNQISVVRRLIKNFIESDEIKKMKIQELNSSIDNFEVLVYETISYFPSDTYTQIHELKNMARIISNLLESIRQAKRQDENQRVIAFDHELKKNWIKFNISSERLVETYSKSVNEKRIY